MKTVAIFLVAFLTSCAGIIEYHVPSNDDEFYDMCMGNSEPGHLAGGGSGAHKYCLDRIAIYHENSRKKGRIPYANGDTTVFNYKFW